MKLKKFNINLIWLFFPLMIIFGKIIRWTILKSVLVDMSIGNGMISKIVNGTGFFTSFADTGMSDAAGNASVFFRLINIFGLTTTVGFEIFITIIWNIILLSLILKSNKILNFMQMVFLVVSVAVLNIWDFCLAKEPLQFVFFLIMYFIICNSKISQKTKYILLVLTLLTTVLYYRVYYILIIGFLAVVSVICNNFLLKKKKINKKTLICLLLLLAFVYFILLNSVKIVDISSYNELIWARTRSGQAHTQMVNIFKSTNLIIFSLDYLLMIVRMLFPVELIPMGIKYWPYVFYQIILSYFLIKNILHIKENNKSQNLALYLYIAFLLASATFEPDFGSWVRHEAAIFPILMIITNIIIPTEGEKNESNCKNNKKNIVLHS